MEQFNHKQIYPFNIGFEIHIQIDYTKLYCMCKNSWIEQNVLTTIELGRSNHKKNYEYFSDRRTCNYELDNSLPYPVNKNALSIAKTVAKKLNMNLVKYFTVFRKQIMDGSLTTGFQRTGIVAKGGQINSVLLEELRLEEDSAKKIKNNTYSVCRLGTPLLEIVSKKTRINNEIQLEAFKQSLFDTTEIVRNYTSVRGIGTIRQDINLSKTNVKTQLKGFQDIRKNFSVIVTNEIQRQIKLAKVSAINYSLDEVITLTSTNDCVIALIREHMQFLSEIYLELYLEPVTRLTLSFKPGPYFKISQHLFSLFNLIKYDMYESTRRVYKHKLDTSYLRGKQTRSRYTIECLIHPVILEHVAESTLKTINPPNYCLLQALDISRVEKLDLLKRVELFTKKHKLDYTQHIELLKKVAESGSIDHAIDCLYPPFNYRMLEGHVLNKTCRKQMVYELSNLFRKNIRSYPEFLEIINTYIDEILSSNE